MKRLVILLSILFSFSFLYSQQIIPLNENLYTDSLKTDFKNSVRQ